MMFGVGVRRKNWNHIWDQIEHKNLVFGIYRRNGIVITLQVSDRQHQTLIPLIQQRNKKGSLYFKDDRTAYATLSFDWKT